MRYLNIFIFSRITSLLPLGPIVNRHGGQRNLPLVDTTKQRHHQYYHDDVGIGDVNITANGMSTTSFAPTGTTAGDRTGSRQDTRYESHANDSGIHWLIVAPWLTTSLYRFHPLQEIYNWMSEVQLQLDVVVGRQRRPPSSQKTPHRAPRKQGEKRHRRYTTDRSAAKI